MSSSIPSGWTIVTLENVAEILAGYGFPESLQGQISGDFPFYKVGDISEAWKRKQTVLSTANHYIGANQLKALRATPLPAETTVFAKIGAAIALNRRAMLGVPSLVDNNVMGLSPYAGLVDPKFLFYFVCTLRLDDLSRSTTVPSIRKSDVAPIQFPLAPFREQHRIAEEIERLLTDLDAAVSALKRVQANLKRYRASVLKAACEGRLVPTEAELARKEGGAYETGEQLLARILQERRAKWESDQLAKMIAVGKPPKDDSWKTKYTEPQCPDTNNLPELPEGWAWSTADQITSLITDGEHITPERTLEGVYLLSARNVRDGELSLDEVDFISQGTHDKLCQRLTISPGDVLLSCSGSVGRSCVVPSNIAFSLVRSVAVMRPLLVTPEYLSFAVRSGFLQLQIREKSTQTAQANIFQSKIRSLSLSLPPLQEQQRIGESCSASLAAVVRSLADVNTALVRSERLRQSVLKRAFEGNLVPQDPNDEPASVLLERICTERAANANANPKSGRKRKARPDSALTGAKC